jgi:hypothetical protein
MATVLHETLTMDELRAELERIAREDLGITLQELIDRYRRGALAETEGPWHLGPFLRLYLSANGHP